MIIKDETTKLDTYFSISKTKSGKIHFMMDDCECTMKVKDAKAIIAELKKEILK